METCIRSKQDSARADKNDVFIHTVRQWYPNLQSRTYFSPPLHFNRVPYDVKSLGGQDVLVTRVAKDEPDQTRPSSRRVRLAPPPVYDSDVRDDLAQQLILNCLRALADQRQEVMMVVSHFQFAQFLSKYNFATACQSFPRLVDLPNQFRRGDVDVLIIHKQHGLIIGEVKNVGANFKKLGMTEEKENEVLAKKVHAAVRQLDKAETVLRHLVSDLPNVCITKTLMLPSISSSQLTRTLTHFARTAQELIRCLKPSNAVKIIEMCLCAEHITDTRVSRYDSDQTVTRACEWWQHVVDCTSGTSMNETLYEQLVARFCGPATCDGVSSRKQIKTEGDGVFQTGELMQKNVFTEEQYKVLNRQPTRLFLSGPPGTGKTTTLILQGTRCLQKRRDVHIISTSKKSRAASILLEHKLKTSLEFTDKTLVYRHQFDFEKEEDILTAIRTLECARSRPFVIADEVSNSDLFKCFCDKLMIALPDVNIWAAGMQTVNVDGMETVIFNIPLRSPPVVIREVTRAIEREGKCSNYRPGAFPSPTDGPPIKYISHKEGQPNLPDELRHTGRWPRNCRRCGHDLAGILRELNVGHLASHSSSSSLQFSDVMVLFSPFPRVDESTGLAHDKLANFEFIKGLEERGTPVRVVETDDEAGIRDTTLAAINKVTVSRWDDVMGLKWKVVVVGSHVTSENIAVHLSGTDDRLYAYSSCTSQLILIDFDITDL